jgi:hypothetical protein
MVMSAWESVGSKRRALEVMSRVGWRQLAPKMMRAVDRVGLLLGKVRRGVQRFHAEGASRLVALKLVGHCNGVR